MSGDARGKALVGAQFVCLAGLAWPGAATWSTPGWVRGGAVLAVVGGGVLALAGGGRLGSSLSPFPAPVEGAELRTDGAYALVRHPIYTGLLAAATGVAVLRGRPEPLAAVAVLSAVLHVKAGYEEGLLRDRFGAAYEEYAARVPRLVPRPRRS